jgi:diadenosine tetraphosphate (Ap4A) HIT family hydrolase
MNFLIPIERLRETRTLYAFYHPQPSYKFHVLLVPKQAYSSLADLSPSDSELFADLISTVQSLVLQFNLDQHGYRLITNGGQYQEVPILHFHLVADNQ